MSHHGGSSYSVRDSYRGSAYGNGYRYARVPPTLLVMLILTFITEAMVGIPTVTEIPTVIEMVRRATVVATAVATEVATAVEVTAEVTGCQTWAPI